MHRSSFLAQALLVSSVGAFTQTTSTDSQTLRALLTEVRGLRQDLQSTTLAAQRAQILVTAFKSRKQPPRARYNAWITLAQSWLRCRIAGSA